MSKIDELIQELCPDGVEFRELGQIVNILDHLRKPVTKTARTTGQYPYYGANGIQDYVGEYILDGTYLLVGEDGSVINKDGSPILNWAVGKIWVNNHAHVLSEISKIASLRFVFFCLQTIDITKLVRGVPPKLNQRNLRSILIPIPPLPIQEEIVRILDKFTKLEAELEAELEARKKQYEYYRNQLLSPIEKDGKWYMNGNEVGWKTLGEVCVSLRKGTLKRGQLVEDGAYPVINSGREWYGFYESYNNEADALIIAARGEYAGFVSYISTKFWAGGLCYPYRSIKEDVVHTKFIYYYLKNNEQSIMDVLVSRGSIPAINKSDVDRIQIPIPPLSEQERIVSILDRFDALVNDISIGLPAEIEARRKQYEYYRGKLLSFKNIADKQEV